ncbi:MAG TPA: glycosyltransferase [Bacillota bacterium]|nr:glycosyltransferase [Bacillota bacterium]
MSVKDILIVMGIFLVLSLFLIVMLFLSHKRHIAIMKKTGLAENYLVSHYLDNTPGKIRFSRAILLKAYISICEEITLTDEAKNGIQDDFIRRGIIRMLIRRSNSIFVSVRKKAIASLYYFDTPEIKKTLLKILEREKKEHVKIYVINSLKNKIDQQILQAFVDSIIGSRRFYQRRLIGILNHYLLHVEAHLANIFRRQEMEIKEVFVDLSNIYYREEFRDILTDELKAIEKYLAGEYNITYTPLRRERVMRLYYGILSALAFVYGTSLDDIRYLDSEDSEVVRIASDSFCNRESITDIMTLINLSNGTLSDDYRSHAILKITENNPLLIKDLLEMVPKIAKPEQRLMLAHVFSHRVDYLLLRLLRENEKQLSDIIQLMAENGYTADFIDFLNKNRDKSIDASMKKMLQPIMAENEIFAKEMSEYLSDDKRKYFGLAKPPRQPRVKKIIPEVRKTKWLLTLLIVAIVLCPVIFVLTHLNTVFNESFNDIIKDYVRSLNIWFIGYYFLANCIYFFLALLSYVGDTRQRVLWNAKNKSMLFEKDMLPSISIIAPAYNEELSIIESVHSLLNLDYPSFEVIVVNDGSKDKTLEKLIDHFQLERKNVLSKPLINTKPVRSIYVNSQLPNLVVVDKENGGKADALNVGINLSHSEYVCGIDADSLLERDSLMNLMSTMLDHDEITLALGGAIVPVNGFIVDKGQIEAKLLPKSLLARLQVIEYLRAFNISRTGFAELRSLLIVSGAFGLFEKRILIEVGGYLTESSLNKDTVGEDMELVVRITRRACLDKLNYRIGYSGTARCYTEVPEDGKTFFRQRNRWQRGLIDILSYHRKMIMNPKYRLAGFVAMPYFFIFEMLGPLFEIQAYAAVLLGILFGFLSIEIILLLLLVTIVMGIFLSLLSLCISEKVEPTFKPKDIIRLLVMAVIENFGWRQYIALYRVKGFFSSLKENNAWGEMNRVGFRK